MDNTEETKRSGGIFGAVLVVIIVVGIIIYLLPRNSDTDNTMDANQEQMMDTNTSRDSLGGTTTTDLQADSPDSLEQDLNSFDSSTDDVSFDDVNL